MSDTPGDIRLRHKDRIYDVKGAACGLAVFPSPLPGAPTETGMATYAFGTGEDLLAMFTAVAHYALKRGVPSEALASCFISAVLHASGVTLVVQDGAVSNVLFGEEPEV